MNYIDSKGGDWTNSKYIDGMGDRYKVTDDGRIYARDGREKKQTPDKDGYMIVSLSDGKHSAKYKVHRLVGFAFVPGWFEGAEIDHVDNNRANNDATNLRWVTHRENVRRSIDSGTHVCRKDLTGENNPNYGNHKLRYTYQQDKELSVQKQSRPGTKNGRSIRVMMDNDVSKCFGCITECAKYLIEVGDSTSRDKGYVATKIRGAAADGSEYSGHIFTII